MACRQGTASLFSMVITPSNRYGSDMYPFVEYNYKTVTTSTLLYDTVIPANCIVTQNSTLHGSVVQADASNSAHRKNVEVGYLLCRALTDNALVHQQRVTVRAVVRFT